MTQEYLSFDQVIELYPLSSGALRRYLMHRNTNGLSRAVLKTARKLVFNRRRFEEWLESFAESSESSPNRNQVIDRRAS